MIRENSKRKSISEIKQELEQADIESRKELLEIYKEDSRAGVPPESSPHRSKVPPAVSKACQSPGASPHRLPEEC